MFLLLVITFVILLLLHIYGTRNHDYWKKKGVIHEKPMVLFGSALQQYIEKVSFSERLANLYWRYPNEKYVGTYNMCVPSLLLRDVDLIRHVLVVDFKHFHHRGFTSQVNNDNPILQSIFHADGDIWKVMRQKLTPLFTSGKLKAMFLHILEQTDKLLATADNMAEEEEVDVRELMARYTTDVIGTCGLGVDVDSLNEEDSDFRKLGKRMFNNTMWDVIIGIAREFLPEFISKFCNVPTEAERIILSIIQQIMSQRNYKPSGRNDFIDYMLELKQNGKITGESIDKHNEDGSPLAVELEPTDGLLAAQAFVFFAAGFETSASSSSFLLHLLAFHPEEQVRCQQEVDEVLNKYDGKLSFNAVKDMKYLEMALREALRILPSPGFLTRQCVKTYTFPGTDLTIDKGTKIIISTLALHHDPAYFENPDQFIPSRFEKNKGMEKYAYMPFGGGPRMCIGERLGLMQSMAGVAAVLSKFSLTPSKSSVKVPRIDSYSFLVENIIGGLPLYLKRRTRSHYE